MSRERRSSKNKARVGRVAKGHGERWWYKNQRRWKTRNKNARRARRRNRPRKQRLRQRR